MKASGKITPPSRPPSPPSRTPITPSRPLSSPSPSPIPTSSSEQLTSEISALQSKIGWLQDKVRLAGVRDAIEDLQVKVVGMAQQIASMRSRGYVFESDLETQAKSFVESWAMFYPNLNAQINSQSAALMTALRPVEMQLPQLTAAARNPAAARGLLNTMQSSVSQMESKVASAERMITGMYDQFQNQISATLRHLAEIEYLLTQLAEASFQLLPTEGGIAAVKAVWCKTGKEQKDDPEGVLYLTDQRILFEQKEEVATKKVLFIATEKQKVQRLQFEAPVALVDKVNTSKAGLMRNEEHIEIRFVSGAPLEMAHLHIWQENTTWQALINRAKTKDFDKGRAVAIDQAEVEKVKAAPAQCPSCGGNITQVVLRGMDSIKCEYCGFVIRL